MKLRFECPNCGQHLSATPDQVGVVAPCPNCNASITVPNPLASSSLSSSITPPQSHAFHFTKDPTRLTAFLKVMLWICVGVDALFVFIAIKPANGGTLSQSEAHSYAEGLGNIAPVHIVVTLITSIAFLKWIYRANLNCHGFGAQDMRFTPLQSIGCYFVPFLNLVRPYRAMKEIWMVSKNPVSWQAKSGSALLVWWWTLWLTSAFLGPVSFLLSRIDHTSLADTCMAILVTATTQIPVYIISVSLISRIYKEQKALVEQVA